MWTHPHTFISTERSVFKRMRSSGIPNHMFSCPMMEETIQTRELIKAAAEGKNERWAGNTLSLFWEIQHQQIQKDATIDSGQKMYISNFTICIYWDDW